MTTSSGGSQNGSWSFGMFGCAPPSSMKLLYISRIMCSLFSNFSKLHIHTDLLGACCTFTMISIFLLLKAASSLIFGPSLMASTSFSSKVTLLFISALIMLHSLTSGMERASRSSKRAISLFLLPAASSIIWAAFFCFSSSSSKERAFSMSSICLDTPLGPRDISSKAFCWRICSSSSWTFFSYANLAVAVWTSISLCLSWRFIPMPWFNWSSFWAYSQSITSGGGAFSPIFSLSARIREASGGSLNLYM
mmetsp:Transcript_25514/g.41981  ORF Transcript_25514/g.41981 Transcript_25514/m.41981 type:complete len:250 (-) Transcript_25514:121-870(-)